MRKRYDERHPARPCRVTEITGIRRSRMICRLIGSARPGMAGCTGICGLIVIEGHNQRQPYVVSMANLTGIGCDRMIAGFIGCTAPRVTG